jgi:hypothetical protein
MRIFRALVNEKRQWSLHDIVTINDKIRQFRKTDPIFVGVEDGTQTETYIIVAENNSIAWRTCFDAFGGQSLATGDRVYHQSYGEATVGGEDLLGRVELICDDGETRMCYKDGYLTSLGGYRWQLIKS